MIRFLYSLEFLVALLIFMGSIAIGQFGNLANFIQDASLFGWAYVIYHHHRVFRHLIKNKGKG